MHIMMYYAKSDFFLNRKFEMFAPFLNFKFTIHAFEKHQVGTIKIYNHRKLIIEQICLTTKIKISSLYMKKIS